MWGTVLVWALFTAFNPVRLGIVALVISRPRPMQNLLAYWIGGLFLGLPTLLVPMLLLNATPAVSSFAQNLATSSTFRHSQVAMGVIALAIAALMTARIRSRNRAPLATPANNTSTLVLDPATPPSVSRLLNPTQSSISEGTSAIQRWRNRAHNAWESGSPWFALLLGMGTGGPSIDGVVFGLAIIMTSGAALGTQITAAVVAVITMLVVVEIILVSYLIVPERTEAVLGRLHDWVQTHRRKILIAVMAVIGVSLLAQGTGTV